MTKPTHKTRGRVSKSKPSLKKAQIQLKNSRFLKNFDVSITQTVKIKHNGLNQTLIKEIEEDQVEENDFFSIDHLSQTHLEILMSKVRVKNWSHIHERILATSFYMVLKLIGTKRTLISSLLEKLGSLTDKTAHRYVSKFINGDEDILFEENRGKYIRDDIFDRIPDLTADIKRFTIEKVSQKNASFTINELLQYSTKQFLSYEPLLDPKHFISVKGLNRLITSWGFFWGKNKIRPYINGHGD